METLWFWLNLLVGFLTLSVRSSFAFPPKQPPQHALLPGAQHTKPAVHEEQKAPADERQRVKTVRLTCHPDSLEIVIKADMFGVGALVHGDELRLGVEHNDFCRAAASSGDEYRIIAGLVDCGTKHWMTEDSLVYTNLLIYSPLASPDGLIRMDEAVIPIECHYERKYSLSSSSLLPTWIPFMSTQAAVEALKFRLRIMTNDWLYERSSNVFYLGEPIGIEASVRVGYHVGLRVFVSSCVATIYPDIHSVPRYVFVENGCLVDSQVPDSRSHFLPRLQDDKLHLVIDAFRFHNEDRGELYITCHLNAVPVNDQQATNKLCTFVNGRWRSADSNDYLCGQCQAQNEPGKTQGKPSYPGKLGPRGFQEPVWEQEARVGPLLVLPGMQKRGPLPEEELPSVLTKISTPALYGSQWRSGINRVDLKEQLPGPSIPDKEEDQSPEQHKEIRSGTDLKEDAESKDAAPMVTLKSNAAALDSNGTAGLSDISPTASFPLDMTMQSNETAPESGLSDANGPKR